MIGSLRKEERKLATMTLYNTFTIHFYNIVYFLSGIFQVILCSTAKLYYNAEINYHTKSISVDYTTELG